MSMIGNLLRVTNAELEDYLKNSTLLEYRIYNDEVEDPNLTDIDKSWEGILFLLTGQNIETLDHPLGKVLFSGQNIDEEQDFGYGPAQYLTSEQVKELTLELSEISVEALSNVFDPKRMNDLKIYPDDWDESMLNYLLEYFKIVQDTYSTAAINNEAIITFLN